MVEIEVEFKQESRVYLRILTHSDGFPLTPSRDVCVCVRPIPWRPHVKPASVRLHTFLQRHYTGRVMNYF